MKYVSPHIKFLFLFQQNVIKFKSIYVLRDVLVCPEPFSFCLSKYYKYNVTRPLLFSSKGHTQKSTTNDFPLRKAKLLSYQRQPHDLNLLACSSTSRNPCSPFRGAGVLGHDSAATSVVNYHHHN